MKVPAAASFLVAFLFLAACAPPRDMAAPPPSRSLRVANYNLWHGLDPVGVWKFREYETPEGRERRLQAFLKIARETDADLWFLEEVNPAPKLAARLARELGMDEIHQVDNCGMRLGVGLPVNLRSGLAILARKGAGLRKLAGPKLSGPPGFCGDLAGFQWKEFRYGLVGEMRWNGERVLVADTHLHHGPEVDGPLDADLAKLAAEGKIDRAKAGEVRRTVLGSTVRRHAELEALFATLDRLGARETPVIFGGDLNLSPDSEEMGRILARGLASVSGPWDPATGLYTWDLERNPNTKFSLDFELPYDFTDPDVVRVLRYAATRTRRLDYVLFRDPAGRWSARDARLLGDRPVDGLFPSDHFGLAAVIDSNGIR